MNEEIERSPRTQLCRLLITRERTSQTFTCTFHSRETEVTGRVGEASLEALNSYLITIIIEGVQITILVTAGNSL